MKKYAVEYSELEGAPKVALYNEGPYTYEEALKCYDVLSDMKVFEHVLIKTESL